MDFWTIALIVAGLWFYFAVDRAIRSLQEVIQTQAQAITNLTRIVEDIDNYVATRSSKGRNEHIIDKRRYKYVLDPNSVYDED